MVESLEVRELTMMLSISRESGANILRAVVRLSACGEVVEVGVMRESSSPDLVSILGQGPPGGEGEEYREVAVEYPAQQPAQSPRCSHLVSGPEWPDWVSYEESGRVGGQQAGEELHPGVRAAQNDSSRQHVVSDNT